MFLPWRRTLLVGDSVDSMLCRKSWQKGLLGHDVCCISIFDGACLFAVVPLQQASDVFGRRGVHAGLRASDG
jgi:hypothetical protein